MKLLCARAVGVIALMIMSGCIGVTTTQQKAGERMAGRMAARFDTPHYEPFFLPGGSNAVLFVHGFPGSPAQMRPLAESLHAKGWTVRGLLMPGNGKDVKRLTSLTGNEWTKAIQTAVAEMAPKYKRLLVVSYSMGAAMTCAGLTPGELDGLVLIAPYQWEESSSDTFIWTYLHPFMPKLWQPFRKTDLSAPDTKALMGRYFPAEFLSQPEFQDEIRAFTLPIPLIARLRMIVRSAYDSKWQANQLPILIIQGSEDTVAHPTRSRELARRWSGNTRYQELAGDHYEVITPGSPSFPMVSRSVCDFADEVAAAPPVRWKELSR